MGSSRVLSSASSLDPLATWECFPFFLGFFLHFSELLFALHRQGAVVSFPSLQIARSPGPWLLLIAWKDVFASAAASKIAILSSSLIHAFRLGGTRRASSGNLSA